VDQFAQQNAFDLNNTNEMGIVYPVNL